VLKLFNRPLHIFLLYLAVILTFAFIYWALPCSSFEKDLSPSESIYLSVVTITTLGYGDITPVDNIGMFTTALESIIGILIIGVFINSAWKSYSDKMEREQSRKIRESLKESNKKNLISYYSYLNSVLGEYRHINHELTTPISERNEDTAFKFGFKFSDLKDIFGPSLRMKYGFPNSVISIYFEEEKSLVSELKYVLANFGLEDFPKLKELIINFLSVSHVTNFGEALIGYAKYPKEKSTRKMLESLIEKFDELPPKEYHQSNMLTPVIILFQTIPIKMELINKIVEEFGVLNNET
jgi:hypothetical protein